MDAPYHVLDQKRKGVPDWRYTEVRVRVVPQDSPRSGDLQGPDAGGLGPRARPEDAAVVLGDLRIEELAAQPFEAFERPSLARPHQPRIPRHIGGEDRSETAGRGHSRPMARKPH